MQPAHETGTQRSIIELAVLLGIFGIAWFTVRAYQVALFSSRHNAAIVKMGYGVSLLCVALLLLFMVRWRWVPRLTAVLSLAFACLTLALLLDFHPLADVMELLLTGLTVPGYMLLIFLHPLLRAGLLLVGFAYTLYHLVRWRNPATAKQAHTIRRIVCGVLLLAALIAAAVGGDNFHTEASAVSSAASIDHDLPHETALLMHALQPLLGDQFID